MNIRTIIHGSLWRVAAIDLLLLAVGCSVPALSHILSLPLYWLNPMLWVLLLGMVLVRDRRNGYVLALMLPLFSMLVVGMPTPAKAFCMVAEYATVVFVCERLQAWKGHLWGTMGALLVSMLCGKVVYYLLKALVLMPAVLVGTPVLVQLSVMLVSALAFALLLRFLEK